MGFWWFGLATFVHVHAIIILIALCPFPSTRQWMRVFDWRICQFFLRRMVQPWTLYISLAVLCLVSFLDSLHDYHKYSAVNFDKFTTSDEKLNNWIHLSRAQRNYWISGAALIICIVMPRLLNILKENAIQSMKMATLNDVSHTFRKLMTELANVMDLRKPQEYEDVRAPAPDNENDVLQRIQKELEKLNRENLELRNRQRDMSIADILDYYERRKNLRRNLEPPPPHSNSERRFGLPPRRRLHTDRGEGERPPTLRTQYRPRNRFTMF